MTHSPSSQNNSPGDLSDDSQESARGGKHPWRLSKLAALAGVALTTGVLWYVLRDYIDLTYLAAKEGQLRAFQSDHPMLVYGIAFVIYVVITGLSLPGATVLSLLYAWYFGFLRGVILVSFASTSGATIAFLLSRYFFRNAVLARFGDRLESFNAQLSEEGAYYLLWLRLVPLFPFFVINLVMGLTPMTTRTFWWVSQIGMLPGTMVYVYAGSRVPGLRQLAGDGIAAVLSPSQLTQLAIAFGLLGTFPLLAKRVLRWKANSDNERIGH